MVEAPDFNVRRLALSPRDVVVLELPRSVTIEIAARFKADLERQLQDAGHYNRALVLADGIRLTVLAAEDA